MKEWFSIAQGTGLGQKRAEDRVGGWGGVGVCACYLAGEKEPRLRIQDGLGQSSANVYWSAKTGLWPVLMQFMS